VLVGAAVHSVRAVPPEAAATVAGWAAERGVPLHVHLSEQAAENGACWAAYGRTPTGVLADANVLGERTTAVHGIHLAEQDLRQLGAAGTGVCLCPTTERDLADGIAPAASLLAAEVPISLGTDSHAVIDLFEEARAVELDERLGGLNRGRVSAPMLLNAATRYGHRALGRPDAGVLAVGAPADLVTVRLDSVRTAGCGASAETAVFAATASDVTDVVVGGRPVVGGGRHLLVPDVPAELAASVAAVIAAGDAGPADAGPAAAR
jgi:formiminoglutamate deiminase